MRRERAQRAAAEAAEAARVRAVVERLVNELEATLEELDRVLADYRLHPDHPHHPPDTGETQP